MSSTRAQQLAAAVAAQQAANAAAAAALAAQQQGPEGENNGNDMEMDQGQQPVAIARVPGGIIPTKPIHAPPSFAGDGARLDAWVRDMRGQFRWYSGLDADGRVRFAMSSLTGPALDWLCSREDEGDVPSSWEELVAALRTRFQPVLAADVARAQLDHLKQGARQSAQDYITAFRALLPAVPTMSADDRRHRFLAGLRPQLGAQVRAQGPQTLEDAITVAARIDSDSEMARLVPSLGTAQQLNHVADGGETEGGGSTTSTPSALGDTAQQVIAALLERLNAVEHGMRGRSHQPSQRFDMSSLSGSLSQEQIRDRLDRRACFDCGQVGHRKGDARCPGKNKGQNNNRSRGPGKY
jgi:hypothetical protein